MLHEWWKQKRPKIASGLDIRFLDIWPIHPMEQRMEYCLETGQRKTLKEVRMESKELQQGEKERKSQEVG